MRFLTRYDSEVSEPLVGRQGNSSYNKVPSFQRYFKSLLSLLISLHSFLHDADVSDLALFILIMGFVASYLVCCRGCL